MKGSTLSASKMIAVSLVSASTLIACGGDDGRRSTSNSPDLNGLWRMSIESDQNGLSATSNSSFVITEAGDTLQMTECSERTIIPLEKAGDSLSGIPGGPFTIINNDTLTSSSTLGEAESKKMDLDLIFDMGTLNLASETLGVVDFDDLCVVSSDGKVLGTATQELYSANVLYNGNPLRVDISVMGAVSKKTYTVAREPGIGEAQIRLVSESFLNSFNRTEINLRNGSLVVTEDSKAWVKGTFSGEMSSGEVMNGTFSLEKP